VGDERIAAEGQWQGDFDRGFSVPMVDGDLYRALWSFYRGGRIHQAERDAAIIRGAPGLDDITVEVAARLILAQLEPSRG